ncbi:MAG TPA: pentapeptide repeat-containing protein [Alphaproteobacteria bacterium]|jgi:uncharacterized protein YjbI with pentapeptide repeats|nr:pentapeptide repeat-containing protein [Alphaproteobacteria bacterium]MDP6270349.1 pentapeptide repeat-containing protein [Alphaproteobacteria bacterium]MDP7429316.1 pentapeptide repeat-containing protein [Alphaproteobacteria bacterium]HJM49256.1 pentapeptide repeat-containing protein [Alphaproteobacteria bacterium]
MVAELLQHILELHELWLAGSPGGKRAMLTDRNLAGLDLRNVVLQSADLGGADFSNSNLSGANLSQCRLTGAMLAGANLEDASLFRADLSDADLRGACLRGANLEEVDVWRANFQGCIIGADILHGLLGCAQP